MKGLLYPLAIKRMYMKAKVFAQPWHDSKEIQMPKFCVLAPSIPQFPPTDRP